MTETTDALEKPAVKSNALQVRFPNELKEAIKTKSIEESISQEQVVVNCCYEILLAEPDAPVLPAPKPKAVAKAQPSRRVTGDEDEDDETLHRMFTKFKGYLDNNFHDQFARQLAFVLQHYLNGENIPAKQK